MANLARVGTATLARRARDAGGRTREFLSFTLAGDVYAVELAKIREIVSPPPLTPVPRAPKDIIGVCSVRGLLVTVMDLRRRLRLVERPPTRLTRILLANTESEVIGLVVDEVRQVVRMAESEVELTANVLGVDLSEHVLGIGRPGGEVIVLLELESIVAV